ncbi:GatB/YqeY domain-containing protein [Ignatzschineria cameli]|uniref:Glutamyl-tRNA amidotransferase n=1 Tax=Ignatzschineria cameli TaxID=2182793 RepID=A0A2U2ASI2_9GAMM|nr:GatB/YqeY domain-containing protein [Ignatzschineria cameli]PWD86442.1 glutamyl-tRNA amidotransferase [Ignatzschineria cameli]PWD87204.1 glutamyl-tRNA amidotransferase [Ignatzschineria cameli]PWD92178.1 glutamyl-tRNA amidotransferase [Ignatzschineria cameli]PWD93237.1 glutamyl-tRNA amidotransferase [Ignatzschineria cameli]PWD93979.1 glutamyl-tRNA amidotransferase [Ignatzschineria cameli]
MKATIQSDVKDAMRAKEREKVTTLRAILAEIQEAELQKRGEGLSEADYLTILNRMVNQRRESIDQFKKADRADLVEKEEAQLAYIMPYLPEQLSDAEIVAIIDAAMAKLEVNDMSGMGKLMSAIRPELLGKADMGAVSALVKSRLG